MVRSWMVRLAMTAIVPALAVGCCHNHKQQSCGCPCQCAAPDNVAPLVAWLGSEAAGDVTGRVFEVEGGVITVADGWRRGPSVDKGARWEPAEVGAAVADLLAKAEPPVPVYGAS